MFTNWNNKPREAVVKAIEERYGRKFTHGPDCPCDGCNNSGADPAFAQFLTAVEEGRSDSLAPLWPDERADQLGEQVVVLFAFVVYCMGVFEVANWWKG